MKFKVWLEKRGQYNKNNVIVVDVQPMYEPYIHFSISEFTNFLNQSKDILYFYNGPETVGEDNEEQVVDWLVDNGLDVEKLEDITFVDKGYGFFRGWMDYGIDEKIIMNTIRYMVMNRIYDSREIPEEIFDNLVEDEIGQDEEVVYLPHISLALLKKFNNAFLVGGGCQECLKEIKILLDSLNIKYKLMSKFIYGR